MFALAASYFSGYRSAAIGSVNFCYGIGGFLGPFLAGKLRQSYNTWHAPMLFFGAVGFVMVVIDRRDGAPVVQRRRATPRKSKPIAAAPKAL